MRRQLVLFGTLPLLLAGSVSAEEVPSEPATTVRRGVEILAEAGASPQRTSWLSEERARFAFRKGAGFAYDRPLNVGPRDYELGLWAGRVSGRTYGLAFQLRF